MKLPIGRMGKKTEKIAIHGAIKEDLPQIKNLFFESQKYARRFDEDVVVNEQTKQEVGRQTDKLFKEPNGKIFVAEKNKKAVGFIYVAFSPGITKSGWVGEIFVANPLRRKRIGSKLMETGIEWLKQRGARKIELTAFKTNQGALFFYKKHQFKKQPAKFIKLGKEIK